MRILVHSYAFYPSIGGIESISDILAREWVKAGHEVKLITLTPNSGDENKSPYSVIRRPGLISQISLTHWCDIIFQNNISLQLIWPRYLFWKPAVVAIQTWIVRNDGSKNWREMIKVQLLKNVHCISISRAVAEHLPVSSPVIGNPFQDEIFKLMPDVTRLNDLIFVGRLVSDKGLDVLLSALAHLKDKGMKPGLTVVGEGSESGNLQAQVKELNLDDQVVFIGLKKDRELAEILNAHRIMVVPSRWAEPFGIVALEGIACGCVVVGSEAGGLIEAMGPCGMTFPNGDPDALANRLSEILEDHSRSEILLKKRVNHLRSFKSEAVARQYLDCFHSVIK